MSKLTVIWLTGLLVLGIISAGDAEAKALFAQRPASVAVTSPGSISSSAHYSVLSAKWFPTVPDSIILSLPFGRTHEAYWMRLTDYQRQIHAIGRSGYDSISLATVHGCKSAQNEHSKLAVSVSSSGSLSSLSPPGLILRL